MRYPFRVFVFAFAALASSVASAEEKPKAKPAAPAKQEMQIENVTLIVLIKSTIMALQHANQTGNYSVLRDMGSPIFRERFDQAALTAAFASLRSRKVNLAPVLFLAPNLTKQPEMTSGNELHIVGDFPSQPLQIQFDLQFLSLDGAWRLNGLSVDVASPQAQASTPPAPARSANSAPAVQTSDFTTKSSKNAR